MVSWGPKEDIKINKITEFSINKNTFTLFHVCSLISILETSFSIPANPFSLLISSQLVAGGAGGRGEALGYTSSCTLEHTQMDLCVQEWTYKHE